MNRYGLVDHIGKKMQMFCYESLTGCGEGDCLEQLDIRELCQFFGNPISALAE